MKVAATDLRLLRVFDAIARHGGFAGAQAELNLTAPTVSNHLTALEVRLGLKLCHRGRGGFRLTEKGERVLASARRLFLSLEAFEGETAELRGALVGEIRLGIVDCVATDPRNRLDEAVARLCDRSAAVSFRVDQHDPQELQRRVEAGDLHCGIGSFTSRLPGLAYEHLYDERHVLYCGRGHPLFAAPTAAIEEVRRHAVVARGYWKERDERRFGLDRVGATVLHIEPQLILVRSGRYLGFLPEHYARPWTATGALRAIDPGVFAYDSAFELIVRRGRRPVRLIEVFLADLRAAFDGGDTPVHFDAPETER